LEKESASNALVESMKCLQSKNNLLEQENENKKRMILVLEDNLMELN